MNDFDFDGSYRKSHNGFRIISSVLICILIILCSAILINDIRTDKEGTKVITEIRYVTDTSVSSIADLYDQVKDGVVVILNTTVSATDIDVKESTNGGSGFIISEDGYIVTNYHVINASAKLVVKFNDGYTCNATIVGYDAELDVALLKINTDRKLTVLKLGDASMSRTGDNVFVIGFTTSTELFGSLTSGRISYNGRKLDNSEAVYIQTEASINPGNSGGPLFNMNGEVIGICKSKIANDKVDNVCFAISSITFKPILDKLLQIKPTSRVGIGISGIAIEDIGDVGDIKDGVVIMSLFSDGPAALADIRLYDIIVEFDGQPIKRVEDIRAILDIHKDGDVVNAVIVRDDVNNRITVPITLRNVEFYEEETEEK